MNRDDPDARKLIAFCSRLPTIDGNPAAAEADIRWVLAQFSQRRQQLQLAVGRGGAFDHEVHALRCEIGALDAACSVLTQLWQRRFGAPLKPG